jgi:Tellurite resistance protein TerB
VRSYPRNSPEAAGRIVALVLMSDGHVCRSEIEVLERLGVHQRLGLPPGAIPRLVQDLCEDLMSGLCATGSLIEGVDDAMLASFMAEVDSPALRAEVLEIAEAISTADRHLADAELTVIAAARRHWGLVERSAA